jgi:hypothetical protein
MEEGAFVLCILLFGLLEGVEGIQGTWRREPFQERYLLSAASVGDYAIFAGGYLESGATLNKVELYNERNGVRFPLLRDL